jgi:hypothetical protein
MACVPGILLLQLSGSFQGVVVQLQTKAVAIVQALGDRHLKT